MTPVRLEPTALRSWVKHSTTEPLRSLLVRDKTLSSAYEYSMCGSRRGQGVRTPTEKSQIYIGFVSNTCTGPGLLKNHKATIIGTPAKRRLNGVSLECRWWPADSGIVILHFLIRYQSWSPSDKTFWIRTCIVMTFVDIVSFIPSSPFDHLGGEFWVWPLGSCACDISFFVCCPYSPTRGKTCFLGSRQSETQASLLSYRD